MYNLGPFQKYAAEIEEQLEYSEIGKFLLAEGLITREQHQKLSSSIIDAEKKSCFLNIVLGYNIESCKIFLNCLEKSRQYYPHQQLYKKLLPALGKYIRTYT